MADSIQLSIVLTTHARSSYFNPLLEKILAFNQGPFELIIIDDSSDPVISQSIQKGVAESDLERVYFFEHEQPSGRGNSLNEALTHASGTMVWAPLRADRLNESLMKEAIRRFKADPAAFWVLDFNLPEDPMDWVKAAEKGELPDDSCLVWNRNVIHPESFFFNPYMDQLHGSELALRLVEGNVWYKTDPFFVVADDQGIYGHPEDVQEILFTAFRMNRDAEIRKALLAEFMDTEGNLRKVTSEDEYLIQARRLLQQGDAKRALEVIDQFIRRNPDHHEGNRIKVTALERLRRHVEAAELKHSLQKRGKEAAEKEEQAAIIQKESEKISEVESKEPELSVVIPTTGHGKPLLEQALLHLDHAADAATTELIIVDNASIDDTFDYLEQLKEEGFFNIRVITHSVNRGFGASVNTGIEAAKAPLVLIMHNDVQLPENGIEVLKQGLLHSDDTAVAAPLLSDTRNPDQKEEFTSGEPYRKAERAESCCFMVKKDLPIRFDEEYRLCFYDMEDFCKQVLESDLEILIAENVVAEHQKGSTIKMMGIELDPELKWRNRERFYNKWDGNRTFNLPTQGSHPEKFRSLGAPDNPMNPDFEWVQTVQDYLTNEVRTEILREEWSEEEFFTIIRTLLIADERELLRTLEERMDGLQPDMSLLVLFTHYYFKKNIYSRCKHYINMAGNGHPVFDLYRLKIMVADKEFDRAIPLLNDLLGDYPSSPELFYLAGDMYKKNEEEGEAQSFFAMAGQLDPFRFQENEGSFEIDI